MINVKQWAQRFVIFVISSIILLAMPLTAMAYSATYPLPALTGNQREDMVKVGIPN